MTLKELEKKVQEEMNGSREEKGSLDDFLRLMPRTFMARLATTAFEEGAKAQRELIAEGAEYYDLSKDVIMAAPLAKLEDL